MPQRSTQDVIDGIATQGCDSHARANSLAVAIAVSDKDHDDKAEYKGDRCCAFDRRANQRTKPMEIH